MQLKILLRNMLKNMNSFDGLITFYSTHFALKAESTLKKVNIECLLIPGPKELSPNCGVALQFEQKNKSEILKLFSGNKINYEALFEYKT